MIKEFQDMPCPWGGTVGEMIEDTPKHLISKVFLEEKNFTAWYYGRTVLIGDGKGNDESNSYRDPKAIPFQLTQPCVFISIGAPPMQHVTR